MVRAPRTGIPKALVCVLGLLSFATPTGAEVSSASAGQSAQEQSRWATERLASFRQIELQVLRQLGYARRAQNVQSASCLDIKLNQLGVTLRSFELRLAEHSHAVAAGHRDRQNLSIRRMVVLSNRFDTVRNELRACSPPAGGVSVLAEVPASLPTNVID